LGGLTDAAKAKVNMQRLKVAVWNAEEVLDRLLEHYEVMPEDVKRRIPLRREWIIDESDTEQTQTTHLSASLPDLHVERALAAIDLRRQTANPALSMT
jgi:hypothetical protein